MKTVIIGGVAGGATAATRLRRLDEKMEIVLLERGKYISYANCGLPYYIGDVIKEREALLVQTPQGMKSKYNIDVRVENEVTKIMPDERKVIIDNNGRVYEETYDRLIIATGSSPIKPKIEGIDLDNIHTLWTVSDTDKIRGIVDNQKPRTAAVIGGGFIGLEMAENLHERGIEVSLIEAQNQVMPPIDYDMAQLLAENMDMNDVKLYLGDGVSSFEQNEEGVKINLGSGKVVTADLVILSIGVKPNSELAKDAGIELNQRGGIKVDDYLQTSKENIYAVGDVIEINNLATGEKGMIPLAGPANKQGRIVANNIAGELEKYEGTLGTSIAKVFDLNVAVVGANEKNLKSKGLVKDKDYYVALINQRSHAGYYPGATPITLKLIFDKNKKIFGAQAIGQDGVDKRIDVIATTMRLKGDIDDLAKLELAYAPPFSSAKDPVNMAGFVAGNILSGKGVFIDWDEISEKHFLLDITENVERMAFQVPGSHHIPFGEIRDRLEEIPKDRTIVTYCAIGVRSYNVARILMEKGFKDVRIAAGGTSFYKSLHYKGEETKEKKKIANIEGVGNDLKILNCCGLQCPGPIMKVNDALKEMIEGETLKVSATDIGFAKDVENWCARTGNDFISKMKEGKENIVVIRKGKEKEEQSKPMELPQGKSMIVFDGNMDKVLASFIIANGAAAMGRPVTMFFTFWGLNALRKGKSPKVKKTFIEKMFGKMMPRGAGKLKLSSMNMMGIGTKMMKSVMKQKNVASLEELMKDAMNNGVRIVACTMSMDVMGIRKEELIDGVELAGVASYLADAEESNVNLFI